MHSIAMCLQMMSGFFVFVRVVDRCRTKNILSLNEVAMLKCIFLLGWCALVLTFGLGTQVIFLAAVFAFVPAYVLYGERKRQKRLRKEVYELLQTLILRLGAGESLPSALLSAKNSGSEDLKIFFATEPCLLKDRKLSQVRLELIEIQKYLHQALSRLRWIREAWDIEAQFEQKRTRATSMIRAQAGLLCVLYMGLVLFTFSRYQYFAVRYYLNVSFFLFVVGIIVLLAIGRSFRWKV